MARWKNMTKKVAVIIMMAALTMGSATTAFAHSDENGTESQTTETTESTSDTSSGSDSSDLVLEETDTTEEDSGESIDRSNSFTVAGSATVQDDITDDSSKEFLTIVTKNNQTFYLVIDRSTTTDNVYMLSSVDEDDLQAFLNEASDGDSTDSTDTAAAVILPETSTSDEATESKDTSESSDSEDEESETKTLTSTAQKNAGWGLVFVAALGVLAAAYYFKIYKPKKDVDEDTGNEGLEDAEDYEEVDEDE